MTLVVGYSLQDSGTAALELAVVLARSTGEALVVGVIVATPYEGLADHVDGEVLGPLTAWARSVLERAKASVPDQVSVRYEVRAAASIPVGLVDLADEVDASAIVLGSSSKGSLGRISFGSITDRLAHSSPRPVFLAPRGFRSSPQSRVRRVNLAYPGSGLDADLAQVADRLAGRLHAQLRAVTFVVRPPQSAIGTIEESADELVVQAWTARARRALETGADDHDGLGPRLASSLVVGHGITWGRALSDVAWNDGDLLVVGSSSLAPVARLFLGSEASKIVRSSPVPVLLVPGPTAG